VLAVMANQVQWMEQLGNAFLAQQSDVMASVQRLRHAALAAGNLKVTLECHCIIQTSGDQIVILPTDPKLVCIPVYNPKFVYGTWWEPAYPPVIFPLPVGFAYAPGFWIGFEPPIEVTVFGPLWGWGRSIGRVAASLSITQSLAVSNQTIRLLPAARGSMIRRTAVV
jgi:Protein of unknown function (DUF3300)